ncbi:MAG: CDP-paratose 2-epimerase [Dehalococcoidia bacterium]
MTITVKKIGKNHYRLYDKTLVNANIDKTFDFFSNAENLNLITPPWLNFNIQTQMPIIMRHNTIIDYKLKLHIITIHWRSIIDSWDPPNSFVDKQLIGPYKYWNHLHKISKLSDNQTIVEDVVDYKLPFGFIAGLINNLYIKKDLIKIFTYRKNQIISYFNN